MPRREIADEPAPPEDRPRDIGLFRRADRGGRPDTPDGGDRPRTAPHEPADEPPPAAADGDEVPAPRGPHWPHDTRSLPAEPEGTPRLQTVGWRSQESSWLHGRVEELERQLRQRTLALGVSALAAAVALASLAVVVLRDPEPPTAAIGAEGTAAAPADPWLTGLLLEGFEGGEQQATARGGADLDATTARAALSAALARIEELEAADNERAATIASLRDELDATRAEAQTLREHLDVSRQGIERLNALLARATGAEPSAPAPVPAPPETAAPGAAAEATAAGAAGVFYVTTSAVNLRAEPSTAAEVLVVIDEGDIVRRIGGDGDWVQVEHADRFVGVVTGWVYSQLVRPAGAAPDGG